MTNERIQRPLITLEWIVEGEGDRAVYAMTVKGHEFTVVKDTEAGVWRSFYDEDGETYEGKPSESLVDTLNYINGFILTVATGIDSDRQVAPSD